jgi:hypothetical protein
MTDPDANTKNVAGDDAWVGVQAGTVHGGVHIYSTSADDPPEKKFETGVELLNGGMPNKARKLIGEAIEADYVGNKVCFYWQLALVSGRTRHEMPTEEVVMLWGAPRICRVGGDDDWAKGVTTICRLLYCAQEPDADLRPVFQELDRLSDIQRTMIVRHLELFLEGPLKDQVWRRALTRAKNEQLADRRADRAWKFFEADPVPPRVRPVREPMIPLVAQVLAVTATVILGAVTIHIGYLLVQTHRISAFLFYLLSIIGGCFGARGGLEWRFRELRRRAKDMEYGRPRRGNDNAPDGFAKKVDKQFDHYFRKYVPKNVERSAWLAETEGVRASIRDEIVEVYRESRIGVERISWLIRHRVSDVRKSYENGTLWTYRKELETPPYTKAIALSGAAALVAGGFRAVEGAVPAAPASAARSTAIAMATGFVAALAWLHIILERRRYAADRSESDRTLEGCSTAFDKWRAKLADRPTDQEMATWLDYDRKVLLNDALRHYRLRMSNVIAYAFVEAPAGPSTPRARVRNGPWRYQKYHLLVFLLTMDGVRQFNVTLDFEKGTFHDQYRANFRYEAVASVEVRQKDDDERKFQLALVNGQSIIVHVIGPGMEDLQQGENPGSVSEVTLDAAGLHHTLHVLEGIAAEGKEWITQERLREEARLNDLAASVRDSASDHREHSPRGQPA